MKKKKTKSSKIHKYDECAYKKNNKTREWRVQNAYEFFKTYFLDFIQTNLVINHLKSDILHLSHILYYLCVSCRSWPYKRTYHTWQSFTNTKRHLKALSKTFTPLGISEWCDIQKQKKKTWYPCFWEKLDIRNF